MSKRIVETNDSPSMRFYFSSMELKLPIVSNSSPLIEPLQSRINTSSVKPFFLQQMRLDYRHFAKEYACFISATQK